MKLHLEAMEGSQHPVIVLDDEPDEKRRNLVYDFLYDSMRNEEQVLAELDQAEAGTPVLDVCNHYVYASMYPDGRVVLEQMNYLLEDDEKEHPPQTVITIAEARKLILDWIAARDKWYAEREAQPHTSNESQSVFRR